MLFLDGVVRVLVDFTDYESLVLSSSLPSSCASLSLVTSILSAIPLELVRDRYLSQLAAWVAGFPLGSGGEVAEHGLDDETKAWLSLFARRVEVFLGRRRRRAGRHRSPDEPLGSFERGGSGNGGYGGEGGDGGDGGNGGGLLGKGIAEGRSICLLGLVVSEGFAAREDRDQVNDAKQLLLLCPAARSMMSQDVRRA